MFEIVCKEALWLVWDLINKYEVPLSKMLHVTYEVTTSTDHNFEKMTFQFRTFLNTSILRVTLAVIVMLQIIVGSLVYKLKRVEGKANVVYRARK